MLSTTRFRTKLTLVLSTLFFSLLPFHSAFATGTPELAPTNTDTISLYFNSDNYYNFARYGSSDSERLYVNISNPESEQVFLGFSRPITNGHGPGANFIDGFFRIIDPTGATVFGPQRLSATTSNISSYAETVLGPTPIGGAGGYTPFTFDPSGLPSGDYHIEFSRDSLVNNGELLITYFDITVATNNVIPVAQPGRVFAKNWAFFLPSIDKPSATYGWFDRPFNGRFFIYTDDGFVSDIDFLNSGFQPAAFNISMNSMGTGTSGNVIEDRKSLNSGQGNTAEYRIFLDEPDEVVYPSGSFGSLLNDSTELIGCPETGYFLKVVTTQQGVIEILLDQNQTTGSGIYDPGTADRLLAIDVTEQSTDDTPGLYTRYIPWDGLDGLGAVVDVATVTPPVEITFSQGRYHIPLYDAEYNLHGFKSTIIRPTPPSSYVLNYYFDDSNIPDDPNIAGQGQINSEGCVPVDSCHQWNNSDYGNLNTINTYWFAKQEFQDEPLTLISDCGPDRDGDGTFDAVDIDWDNDGIPNYLEYTGPNPTIDSDNDGIPNFEDKDFCTLNAFGICAYLDLDNDGLPTFLDLDADNDGIPDIIEAGGDDNDGNGIVDVLTDSDNDGLVDTYDSNDNSGVGVPTTVTVADDCQTANGPTHTLSFSSVDIDALSDITFTFSLEGDYGADFETFAITGEGGVVISSDQNRQNSDNPTYADCASPGMGFTFTINQSQWNNWNNDGTVVITIQASTAVNVCTNRSCALSPEVSYDIPPAGPGTDIANADTDGDGLHDFLDLDSDNDGIADLVEVGGIDTDGNGMADDMINPATGDTNSNGWSDAITTSPLVNNNLNDTTIDFDNDSFANHLDLDSDNDGITDVIESGGQDGNSDGIADDGSGTIIDVNGDGWGDSYDEATITTTTDGGDTNSIADFNSGRDEPDFDGDGLPNWLDIDADNDGILDNSEGQLTTGYTAPTTDSDGDGLNDAYEIAGTIGSFGGVGIIPENTDGIADGADYLDLDTDNDDEIDAIEGHDTDGDGVGDNSSVANTGVYTGVDSDQDGLDDGYDNNVGSLDPTDGGLTPSSYVDFDDTVSAERDWRETSDIDLDNDGIPNSVEDGGTGFDPIADEDGDGIPNFQDDNDVTASFPSFIDTNNDGINDVYDTDLDGIPDHADLDADNDGIPDIVEAGGTDLDNDGSADDMTDEDNDGLADIYDTDCESAPSVPCTIVGVDIPNEDTDGDGRPDYIDLDSDNDGIADLVEVGGVDTDGNGMADDMSNPLSGDTNTDGWSDAITTSPLVDGDLNDTAINFDGDSQANHLDIDSDNDGITDVLESNGLDGNGDGMADDGSIAGTRTDTNNDGWEDNYDNGVITSTTDGGDANTIADFSNGSNQPDFDGDGQANWLDIDADDDGIVDNSEGQSTIGYIAPTTDSDQDGLNDAYEIAGTIGSFGGVGIIPENTDGVADGADYLDSDSDNDLEADNIEGHDVDGNGIVNGADDPLNNANTGIYTGVDSDLDGLDDGYDNNIGSQDPTDGGLTPSSYVDFDNIGTTERDWRETSDIDLDNDGITNADEDGGTGFSPTGDADGDGIPNFQDDSDAASGFPSFTDINNDGINDAYDQDLDGIPDYIDLDSDNDGIPDLVEAGGVDTNGDGRADDLTDTDGDGLVDAYDSNCVIGACTPATTGTDIPNLDTDGDGKNDYLDIDADNDGIPDIVEAGGTDTDHDGKVDAPLDEDGDGLADVYDENATDGSGSGGTNGTALVETNGSGDWLGSDGKTLDTDGDGFVDGLDLDADNDGIPDLVEAGGVDTDGDGRADDLTDTDGDGLANTYDSNCMLAACSPATTGTDMPNEDNDRDGIVDYLDLDADNDGIPDIIEAGGIDANGDGRVDQNLDVDQDGLADVFDENAADGIGSPGVDGISLVETNGTGIWRDGNTGLSLDTDGDGRNDGLDLDADNDGIPDLIETGGSDDDGDGRVDTGIAPWDADNDGLADIYDENASDGPGNTGLNGTALVETTTDTNSDGRINNSEAMIGGNSNTVNSDTDDLPNHLDLDADNDGIVDILEAGGTDLNGDGLVDDYNPSTPTTFDVADNDGWSPTYDGDAANDGAVTTSGDGTPIVATNDSNFDGFPAAYTLGDSDQDSHPDFLDIDADNDGIVDNVEAQDTPGYTLPDNLDSDGDGIDDAYDTYLGFGGTGIDTDNSDSQGSPYDHDGDGIADYLDTDSDGDNIPDMQEAWDNLFDGDSQVDSGVGTCDGSDVDNDGLQDCFDSDTNSPLVTSYQTPINDNGTEGTSTTASTPTSGADPSDIFPNNDSGDGQPDFRDVIIDCGTPRVYYASTEKSAGTTTDYEFDGTNHVDQSDTKIVRATTFCTPGDGWFYFYNPLEPDNYLFALKNAAGSPNTVPISELIDFVEIKIEEDRTDRHVIDASQANLVMERDWNVALKGTPSPGSTFDVKFYFPPAEMDSLSAAADAVEAMANGSVTRNFYWFGKDGGVSNEDITSSTVTGMTDISTNDPNVTTDSSADILDGTTSDAGNGKNYVTFEGLSNLSGGTAGITMTYAVLPVELISFSAKANDCTIVLDWRAGSEENFIHYEIEKSTDGRNFDKLGQVEGLENTSNYVYNFEDSKANKTNYYRLKMIDLDGSFEYSEVVIINGDCDEEQTMQLYPNPIQSNEILTIELQTQREEAQLMITDMSGNIVRRMTLSTERGWNKLRFNTSDLSVGTYFILNRSEEDGTPTKFIIIDK